MIRVNFRYLIIRKVILTTEPKEKIIKIMLSRGIVDPNFRTIV